MWSIVCEIFKDNTEIEYHTDKDSVLQEYVINKKREYLYKGFNAGFQCGLIGGISLCVIIYIGFKLLF